MICGGGSGPRKRSGSDSCHSLMATFYPPNSPVSPRGARCTHTLQCNLACASGGVELCRVAGVLATEVVNSKMAYLADT